MLSKKRIILLGDGMPDEPIETLGGKTPLQVSKTPNMDRMAREGSVGWVNTVPDGFPPGSDITNMGLLGYDPKKYYSGRAPLEAAGMGIKLEPDDVAYRCNLVTLATGPDGVFMEDFSSGHISSGESAELIGTLNEYFGRNEIEFHPGVSYRHIMIWKKGLDTVETTPPHDIVGQNIKNHLPRGEAGEKLRLITGEAQIVLKKHPINLKRESEGIPQANSIWLWGVGKGLSMPTLQESYGISGTMISAVDLLKGIAAVAGMEVINVEGATGYIDTNYEGKARAAIEALRKKDFVYLHVESIDESGHAGSLENKIRSIEDFDLKIVGPLLEEAERIGGRIMVLSDHPTPLRLKTHTSNPVPFAVFPRFEEGESQETFDESIVKKSSHHFEEGYLLFKRFLS